MKSLSLVATILLLTVLVTSCKITRTITFEEGFSGQQELILDMSLFQSLMEMDTTMDGGRPMMKEEEMAAMTAYLSGIQGISNINISETPDKILRISYRFDNITALNKSMENMVEKNILSMGLETETASGNIKGDYFQLKGKNLTFSDKIVMQARQDPSSKNEEKDEMAGNLLDYSIVMNFPKPVKSVKNSKATISADKKTVTYQLNDVEIMDAKIPAVVKIKL